MSPTKPPARFKSDDEMTVEEFVERDRTGRRPETDAYKAYVRDVHESAGLDVPEPYVHEPDIGDADVEHHLRQITGKRRR